MPMPMPMPMPMQQPPSQDRPMPSPWMNANVAQADPATRPPPPPTGDHHRAQLLSSLRNGPTPHSPTSAPAPIPQADRPPPHNIPPSTWRMHTPPVTSPGSSHQQALLSTLLGSGHPGTPTQHTGVPTPPPMSPQGPPPSNAPTQNLLSILNDPPPTSAAPPQNQPPNRETSNALLSTLLHGNRMW